MKNATLVTGIGDYQLFRAGEDHIRIGVGTKELKVAAPTLLASIYNYPSNETALLRSWGNNTVNFIAANARHNKEWYVSVWAEEGLEYYIWANTYCANDCKGMSNIGNLTRGVCDEITGTCACDKHYAGLYCYRSGLSVIWIVVIVVVCAIIIAILIAVTIAYFLHRRRRKVYENL